MLHFCFAPPRCPRYRQRVCLLTERPVIVAATGDLHNVTLDQDRVLQTRMYSLRPATLAYFVCVKLACLAIESQVAHRQKTHCAFHVAHRHHLAATVHTRLERNVQVSLFKAGHHSPGNITVTAHDDALEDCLDLTPDNRTLFRDTCFIDITISRSCQSTMNELNAGD